jgi:hypothetical protein
MRLERSRFVEGDLDDMAAYPISGSQMENRLPVMACRMVCR